GTIIAEALGHYAPQIRVSAGDQHLHSHDLLVFNVERRPWKFTCAYALARRCDARVRSVLRRRAPSMLLDSSYSAKFLTLRRADDLRNYSTVTFLRRFSRQADRNRGGLVVPPRAGGSPRP